MNRGLRPQYAHVFVDFDGVICDTREAAAQEYNALQATEFPELPRLRTADDLAGIYRGSLATCLSRWLDPVESRRFFNLHAQRMSSRAAELCTFPGVSRMLAQVGHKRTSIVTGAHEHAVRAILGNDPEFDWDCIFALAAREWNVPREHRVRRILKDLSLPPEHGLVVGDMENDIIFGNQVPMDVIAVSYGYQPANILASGECGFFPNCIVGSVPELAETILPRFGGHRSRTDRDSHDSPTNPESKPQSGMRFLPVATQTAKDEIDVEFDGEVGPTTSSTVVNLRSL